ncbi:response regulator [Silvanigrella sp.]|jgi:CheY-like chemotaxis protein|uniref:response regulator n=1 Tax=Silvanigrella sp. TaxID=2024976 RepID=UPI0037CCAF91
MSKLNVLVVDASKSVLASVNDYFDNIDEFKLFLAKSGKDALETIEDEKNIDCVFLDWDLPVMNGLEALVEIKKTLS